MKKIVLVCGLLLSLMATVVSSCEDVSTTVGSSLVDDNIEVVIDSSYTITGHSELNSKVQSRTITQLLGRIEAKGFGSFESEIVTQFMPGLVMDAEKFTENDIDSVKLVMQMSKGAFTGDSLVPMGLRVYPLTKQLPSPIYSDFDPKDYYDASNEWGKVVYSASAIGATDEVRKLSTRNIEVMLPLEFAKSMYRQYRNSPATFATPQSFAEWFPGLYISNSFGNGRVTRIDKSYITMFYHIDGKNPSTGNDTTYLYANTYLAVTPEIITNNDIRYRMADDLKALAASGEALLVAPTGYNVTINFPATDIIETYRNKGSDIAVVNTLTMEIPVENIPNDYGIQPPKNVLLVKKSEAAEFFANNMVYDNVSSFIAEYSASRGSYTFSNMRDYILGLIDKETVKPEDMEFSLIPVNVVTETTSYGSSGSIVTAIAPYVTMPVMGRLLLDKAKIKFTFSKQTL